MTPQVSVVIPVFNAGRHIEPCLASAFDQGADLAMEVIVVDDGSTDETVAKLREFPQLICLQQSNAGPAAARNAGVRRARGEFVAFLDADDLWPEGKLRMQIDMLMRHPDAAMCFGDCRQFEESSGWPRTLFETGGYGERAWGAGPYLQEAYTRLLRDNFITTGSVVVRRQVLDALGGFDQGLHLVEDLELWLRIARQYPIIWCNDVCLLRRKHPDNISRDPEAMSLAYLEVLKRQQPPDLASLARDVGLNGLFAREYQDMANRALVSSRPKAALRWAWRSFVARPSLRALWQLTQGAKNLMQRPGQRHDIR